MAIKLSIPDRGLNCMCPIISMRRAIYFSKIRDIEGFDLARFPFFGRRCQMQPQRIADHGALTRPPLRNERR
jgi:hypothetical protein